MGNTNRRGLAGFQQVSGDAELQPTPAIPEKSELEKYYKEPDTIPKKQVSIYLDEDVIKALNKWGKNRKKGAKSELVNNFLRQNLGLSKED